MSDKNTSDAVVDETEASLDESVAGNVAADNVSTDEQVQDEPAEQSDATSQPEGEEALQQQIDQLTEALQTAKEDTLRNAAEMQNLRKRAERDVENAHKFGQEKLISSLLPMLDNLDRAIETAKKEGEEAELPAVVTAMLEGVELTRKSALDALKQFSVEAVEPYGEPFDPQFHQAMTMIPSDTAEPNSVIDVLQKGYSLNGRLLRAAMVVVAKP